MSLILFSLFFVAILVAPSILAYLAQCYVFFRVGRKFDVGSFGLFCIPVYNLVLLCRCAGISAWHTLGLLLPGLQVFWAVYLWGSIARRLGYRFWLWGIGALFVYPILILAFEHVQETASGLPADGSEDGIGGRDLLRAASPIARANMPYVPRPAGAHAAAAVLASAARRGARASAAAPDDPGTPHAPVAAAQAGRDAGRPVEDTAMQPTHEVPRLYCIEGTLAGQVIDVAGTELIMGRDPRRAGLVITSDEVSGTHAQISPIPGDPQSLYLQDLGSTNGTFYRRPASGSNGAWERVVQCVVIARGEQFRIGATVFQVL